MAASGYTGYYGYYYGGYSSASILNANIRRKGAALSGEIKTIATCDCHPAMSEKITFTATKSAVSNP
jgi:shikimate kinase